MQKQTITNVSIVLAQLRFPVLNLASESRRYVEGPTGVGFESRIGTLLLWT